MEARTAAGRYKVLVTRPEPGAGETAAALEAMGWRPVLAPMLRIVPAQPHLPGAAVIQAILATSGNAIQCLRTDPALRRRPLLAVGEATARRARDAGFERVHSGDGDALALAALAQARLSPAQGPVLLVSGAGQGAMLATLLREAGFGVIRRVGYAAEPVRELPEAARAVLLEEACLHAALFFSAETARAFRRALPERLRPRLAGCAAIAISTATATPLARLGFGALRVARVPKASEMLALL